MHESQISIKVTLDEDKMPETIRWHAPDGGVDDMQEAKAMFLGIWDKNEKSALRIDLWTKKMMVDEMADFYFQTLMGMADTYNRATKNNKLSNELRVFAKSFHQKAIEAVNEELKNQ